MNAFNTFSRFLVIGSFAVIAFVISSSLKPGSWDDPFIAPWDPIAMLAKDVAKFERELPHRADVLNDTRRVFFPEERDPDPSRPYHITFSLYYRAVESKKILSKYFESETKEFRPQLKYSDVPMTRKEAWDICYGLHISAAEGLMMALDRPRDERSRVGLPIDFFNKASYLWEHDEVIKGYVLSLLKEVGIVMAPDTSLKRIKAEIIWAKNIHR